MSCTDKTKPINGASAALTITGTASTLATLGLTVNPDAERIVVSFNMAVAGTRDPIARLARDDGFSLSATEGEPIVQASKIELTKEQFGALFIATSGTVDVFVEQFEIEV